MHNVGIAPYRHRAASVGVAVNVPLFAGFAVQERVRETLSLQDKARAELEGARRNVTQMAGVAQQLLIVHDPFRVLRASNACTQPPAHRLLQASAP